MIPKILFALCIISPLLAQADWEVYHDIIDDRIATIAIIRFDPNYTNTRRIEEMNNELAYLSKVRRSDDILLKRSVARELFLFSYMQLKGSLAKTLNQANLSIHNTLMNDKDIEAGNNLINAAAEQNLIWLNHFKGKEVIKNKSN